MTVALRMILFAIGRNCLYTSAEAQNCHAKRSSATHKDSKSTVRKAALPYAIRRSSSTGSISVNAAAIVQSRPLPRGKQDAESSVQPAAISVAPASG